MTQSTSIRKSTVPSARLLMVAVVLLFAGFQLAFAQQLDVRGTVVSATDGTYRIRVNRGAILVVSAIGFETQEVAAQAGTVDVILAEDNLWLNDAVVIGYGVQKKKLVTGSTVQVKSDDVAKLNTVDVLGALQSQSPGVNITQNSGFLGAGFKVNIRGLGKFAVEYPAGKGYKIDNWDEKGMVPYITKDGKMWAGTTIRRAFRSKEKIS